MAYIDGKEHQLSGIGQTSHNTALWNLSSVLIVAYIVIPLTYWSLLVFDKPIIERLLLEDGIIESLAAVSFLSAALTFFYLYYRSVGVRNKFFGFYTRRNLFFVLLGVFSFFCFGEEISWGQRVFDWSTPEIWQEINAQNETNLHNLWFFRGRHPDGTEKSFLENLTNESRLLSMFWLTYCILIPILYFVSRRLRSVLDFTGLPIPPVIVSGLFVVSYISYRLANATFDVREFWDFMEFKETNNAVIFAILAVYYLVRHRFVINHYRAGNTLN